MFLLRIFTSPGRICPSLTYPRSSPGSQLPYVVHVTIYPTIFDILQMITDMKAANNSFSFNPTTYKRGRLAPPPVGGVLCIATCGRGPLYHHFWAGSYLLPRFIAVLFSPVTCGRGPLYRHLWAGQIKIQPPPFIHPYHEHGQMIQYSLRLFLLPLHPLNKLGLQTLKESEAHFPVNRCPPYAIRRLSSIINIPDPLLAESFYR